MDQDLEVVKRDIGAKRYTEFDKFVKDLSELTDQKTKFILQHHADFQSSNFKASLDRTNANITTKYGDQVKFIINKVLEKKAAAKAETQAAIQTLEARAAAAEARMMAAQDATAQAEAKAAAEKTEADAKILNIETRAAAANEAVAAARAEFEARAAAEKAESEARAAAANEAVAAARTEADARVGESEARAAAAAAAARAESETMVAAAKEAAAAARAESEARVAAANEAVAAARAEADAKAAAAEAKVMELSEGGAGLREHLKNLDLEIQQNKDKSGEMVRKIEELTAEIARCRAINGLPGSDPKYLNVAAGLGDRGLSLIQARARGNFTRKNVSQAAKVSAVTASGSNDALPGLIGPVSSSDVESSAPPASAFASPPASGAPVGNPAFDASTAPPAPASPAPAFAQDPASGNPLATKRKGPKKLTNEGGTITSKKSNRRNKKTKKHKK